MDAVYISICHVTARSVSTGQRWRRFHLRRRRPPSGHLDRPRLFVVRKGGGPDRRDEPRAVNWLSCWLGTSEKPLMTKRFAARSRLSRRWCRGRAGRPTRRAPTVSHLDVLRTQTAGRKRRQSDQDEGGGACEDDEALHMRVATTHASSMPRFCRCFSASVPRVRRRHCEIGRIVEGGGLKSRTSPDRPGRPRSR